MLPIRELANKEIPMKKSVLINLLRAYDDDQEILVETSGGGFDSPVLYITAVHPRPASSLVLGFKSEYVDGISESTFGALVLGTTERFLVI